MALLAVTTIIQLLELALATPVVVRGGSPSIPNSSHPSCDLLIDDCTSGRTVTNIDRTWSSLSCVAAATCETTGTVLQLICDHTGACPAIFNEKDLPSDIYTDVVGTCSSQINGPCVISRENYTKFFTAAVHSIDSGQHLALEQITTDSSQAWGSLAKSIASCGSNCEDVLLSYDQFNGSRIDTCGTRETYIVNSEGLILVQTHDGAYIGYTEPGSIGKINFQTPRGLL
ncbi:hypothetical protein B0H11DRAFT_2310207 [Mycena galericulata]|nr:hypothetical protein B0H11DRAFT_2310207 [Mycena galericulata]